MAEEANTTNKDQENSTHIEEEKNTVEKQEKTFTQAELDKVISDRLARSLRKQGLRWN